MKTRIQKWGNSLALRIPKSFALETGLEQDATVDVALTPVEPLAMRYGEYGLRARSR